MLTLEQALKEQERYRARPDIRAKLSDTALVAFVGPTAVGKNHLMRRSGLPVVGTVTSRPPRPSDEPEHYSYHPVEELLEMVEAREAVQYGAAPPDLYLSRLGDYALSQPNASDIWSNAVYALENKGFKAVLSVGVLTPKPQWIRQMNDRFEGTSAANAYARLDEARQSIRWIMARHHSHSSKHLTVVNDATHSDENIATIQDFAYGKRVTEPSDLTVNTAARAMLEAIDTMYGRLTPSR